MLPNHGAELPAFLDGLGTRQPHHLEIGRAKSEYHEVCGPLDFELTPLEACLVETEAFQRIARVNHLGLYPLTEIGRGADRSRLAHSYGVVLRADQFCREVTVIEEYSGDSLAKGLAPRERQLVRLAALVHDVAHLAFSHILEQKARTARIRV